MSGSTPAAAAPKGTAQQAAALAIFCAVVVGTVLLVLVPLSLPIPAAAQRRLRLPPRLALSYAGVPLAGTLLMLAAGALDGASLAAGIVGDDALQPYGIVILFMSLAYMSTCERGGRWCWSRVVGLCMLGCAKSSGRAATIGSPRTDPCPPPSMKRTPTHTHTHQRWT
jgi:hypothetical protein